MPPARQFVEYFIKKWPQKRLFKTFNIEKNNRQTYCKQAVILCVLSIFSTKKRVLNDKNHHFAGLPTCLCPAKAYTLGTSSNAFGKKDAIKNKKTTKEIYKNLFINHIQKSLVFGVFAPKLKVVRKYAKERRVCCQENSLCLIGSHFLSSTKQIGQILAHTVC